VYLCLRINGKPKGFQHIARDITEEKQQNKNIRYYIQQITRAQEEERKRLSRELHDECSFPLLLLIQRIGAYVSTEPDISPEVKVRLEDFRAQAIEALEGLRRCAQNLRPRILDDLGLVPALEWMAEKLSIEDGINARVKIASPLLLLMPETQLILFRIAQVL